MCAKNGRKDKIRTEYYYHGMACCFEHESYGCSLKHMQMTVGKRQSDCWRRRDFEWQNPY